MKLETPEHHLPIKTQPICVHPAEKYPRKQTQKVKRKKTKPTQKGGTWDWVSIVQILVAEICGPLVMQVERETVVVESSLLVPIIHLPLAGPKNQIVQHTDHLQ